MKTIRTDSTHPDFIRLVELLDADLLERYGAVMVRYDPFNQINGIRHAVVLYVDGTPAACGAFKEYAPGTVEIKRVYVDKPFRGQGLSKIVMGALEAWAVETGYDAAVLETGSGQPEAISLYHGCGYRDIPNYPPYIDCAESLCMKKDL